MKSKNNAYRFNPFYRNVEFPMFKSNPNAQLPISELVINQDWICPSNGKLWDDSDISDYEMDREMELMNRKRITLFG